MIDFPSDALHLARNAVEEGQETFDELVDLVCVARPDGTCEFFNQAWRRYAAGFSLKFASPEWTELIHLSDRPVFDHGLAQAIRSGEPFETELRLQHPTDLYRWFFFRAHPRTDDTGKVRTWFYVLTDIHQRKTPKQGLAEKSRFQVDMLNASLDCIRLVAQEQALAHGNTACDANAGGCDALNAAEDCDFGVAWLNLLPQEVYPSGKQAFERALAGQNARFAGISRAPGEPTRYWDNMLTPLVNADDELAAVLCVSRDVTVQQESERRIELLLHEVNHRSKNMLSVMQALVRRSVPDPEADFVKALEQRIAAIARSQDLLIQGQWTGAKVREVIVSETAGAGNVGEDRLLLDGDTNLRVCPKAAEVLGLAIHELTTNAIKYGAFSNERGKVKVEWAVRNSSAGANFHMRWKESGGPNVVQPSHRGFGSVVIERNPGAALQADVTLSYDPEGLTWEFNAPASSVLAQ